MGEDHVFLRACRREPTEYTPVWLMRQAGRYMEEYRDIRRKVAFLDLCKSPDLAAEVTLLPVRKLGVDAAIIFGDILLPLEGMGFHLEFAEGEGPLIRNPIKEREDIERLRIIEPEEHVSFFLKAIEIVRRELEGRVPLIGFSGAPFTLASYLIEGGHSKDYSKTKGLMLGEPSWWHLLMEKLTEVTIRYLRAQVHRGAHALQLFDSWAGCLSPRDYEDHVLPYSKRLIQETGQQAPLIHFSVGTSGFLHLIKEAGGDVIGIDWRMDLKVAWERLGYDVGIQGNLDPSVLLSSHQMIEAHVQKVLESGGNRPGHIFNLGHGVLPETPVENVIFMVEAVHRLSRR
ncbi:MAG: uroporphyrinogen decarboxylase [Syntrophobacterales bacterium]|nr:MAG: uroporphyrinogen decarboxylase [Syntrophobacterales bacterium]